MRPVSVCTHIWRAKVQKNIYICKLFLHIARKWIGFVQKGIKKRTIKDYLTVRFENQPLIVRRTGVLRWKAFLSRS